MCNADSWPGKTLNGEPQLLGLQTALRSRCKTVTQCTGHIWSILGLISCTGVTGSVGIAPRVCVQHRRLARYIPLYVPCTKESENSTSVQQGDMVVLQEEVGQTQELRLVQTAAVFGCEGSHNQHPHSCMCGGGGEGEGEGEGEGRRGCHKGERGGRERRKGRRKRGRRV